MVVGKVGKRMADRDDPPGITVLTKQAIQPVTSHNSFKPGRAVAVPSVYDIGNAQSF
jgi:hypothetical protein